jgi:hypothetical protein
MNRWLILSVPLLVIGALLGACGGDDNKTVDIPGGGQVEVGDDLPDDFPDDFPQYDGAKIISSYSGEQDGQQGSFVLWETDDSVDDVKDFYTSEFEDGPWTSTGDFSSSGTSIISAENESGDMAAAVSISEGDGKTTISVFLGDNPDGSSDEGSSDDDSSSDDGSSDDGDSSGDDDSSSGDDSGSSSLPDEVDLEDAYPQDTIPLPSGARVTSSSSFTSGGSSTVFVELYVEQTPDELKTYYEDTMADAGYTASFSSSANGENFMSFTEPEGTGTNAVTINITNSEVDGYSLVAIGLTEFEQ